MSSKHSVYLHLGSNLGDCIAMLQKATRMIANEIGTIRKASPYYETEPWGLSNQPNFINQALLVETDLSPLQTLHAIHDIEAKCGRERIVKWSARIIDIDIIFYEDRIINTPTLTLPHPHMHLRNFVLIPMMDIAPDFIHPVLQVPIDELYNQSNDTLEVFLLDD